MFREIITVEHKSAIVLAMFGTAVESGLPGLLHVRELMARAWPQTPVRIAFTSNIIRRIWRQRAQDRQYAQNHPEVPAAVLKVQGPLAAIANLLDAEYDSVVVQPVQIAPAGEFFALAATVESLNSIRTIKPGVKPVPTLAIGRPALGTFGAGYPYVADVRAAAESLAADARLAEEAGAALLYMGHGSNYFPSGGIYLQFAAAMRELYPGVLTVIANLEGFPSVDDALVLLRESGTEKVILKPFLVAAGGHVRKDMVGPGSWKARLEREGFTVEPILSGLAEQDSFVRIFIDHAADAAADAGIVLR
ncbi:MAG TPA: sirohydrochlorin cobaltochelatase [Desulfobacteraceae bacterium]|nr:sirohydrochlorin cobaltochelatase CbiKC [bacterium BMS3Abin13]HDK44255.1 sirohydrochlorin cobaltochelatase [Desulfobacteraceae bacterium]